MFEKLPERLKAKIEIAEEAHPVLGTPCWNGKGYLRPNGYRELFDGRRCSLGHKVIFQLLVGPVPAGKLLDHLCRNRECCNPAHLEPVTTSVNTKRGWEARGLKERCVHGHVFTPETTRYSNVRGCRVRRCLICLRQRRKGKLKATGLSRSQREVR